MALIPADLSGFEPIVQKCQSVLASFGYAVLVDERGQYYVVPPNQPAGSDPPAQFKLKKRDTTDGSILFLTNPVSAKDLKRKLDQLVDDEMDFDQMDGRWRAKLYGPATAVVADKWSSMRKAGCGPAVMTALLNYLYHKYGKEFPMEAGGTGDEQTRQIMGTTHWLSTDGGQVKGGGTLQGRIDPARFKARFPGFKLTRVPDKIAALNRMRNDEMIILNGVFYVFTNPPTQPDQVPTDATGFNYSEGHNILLWCVDTSPKGFDIVRIFDPGGGFKFTLGSQLDNNKGNEFWAIERDA